MKTPKSDKEVYELLKDREKVLNVPLINEKLVGKGLTVHDLARKVKADVSTVRGWIKHMFFPRKKEHLKMLADTLGVEIDELILIGKEADVVKESFNPKSSKEVHNNPGESSVCESKVLNADVILNRMKSKKYSVDDMSKKLKVSVAQINYWLSNKDFPNPNDLVGICNYLGVRVVDIVLYGENAERYMRNHCDTLSLWFGDGNITLDMFPDIDPSMDIQKVYMVIGNSIRILASLVLRQERYIQSMDEKLDMIISSIQNFNKDERKYVSASEFRKDVKRVWDSYSKSMTFTDWKNWVIHMSSFCKKVMNLNKNSCAGFDLIIDRLVSSYKVDIDVLKKKYMEVYKESDCSVYKAIYFSEFYRSAVYKEFCSILNENAKSVYGAEWEILEMSK